MDILYVSSNERVSSTNLRSVQKIYDSFQKNLSQVLHLENVNSNIQLFQVNLSLPQPSFYTFQYNFL